MVASSIRRVIASLVATSALALLAACGSSGAPEQQRTAMLVGKVVTDAKSRAVAQPLAAGDPIVVRVQSNPEITATVAADGTFTLRGLPDGGFTLIFTQGSDALGSLNFSGVQPNQQITIEVKVVEAEMVLVDEDRRGIGHAGVELEGPVQNVIAVSLTADSTFVIAGRTVIARPGVTAIREGNTRKTVNEVTVPRQVHVKGTTLENSTDLLAYEIKLQGPEDTTGGAGEKKMTICHIPPGNPAKAKTLDIGSSAWPAHQAHGDTEGACKP
jgi:hypothetical protein